MAKENKTPKKTNALTGKPKHHAEATSLAQNPDTGNPTHIFERILALETAVFSKSKKPTPTAETETTTKE